MTSTNAYAPDDEQAEGLSDTAIEEATEPPTEAELAQRKRIQNPLWDELYPKPTQGDIETLWKYLQPQWDSVHRRIEAQRDVRYGRDQTPDKYAVKLSGARRVRSRWSGNEILRVAATLGRNPPRVKVPVPADKSGPKAVDKAGKQTLFANQLLRVLERQAGSGGLFRRLLDAAAGDGLGGLEFYMKEDSDYDAIDLDPQDIYDPKLQDYRPETAAETNKRVDAQLANAKLPFGIRRIDPVAIFAEPDEDGGYCRVIIAEYKPYRSVFEQQTRKAKQAGTGRDPRLPRPGTPGWPALTSTPVGLSQDTDNWASSAFVGASNASESVLTLRYYDARWTLYIVGGVLVDGPEEHKIPDLPAAFMEGITTGSSSIDERFQGVTWGLTDIELAHNDLTTLGLDQAYTYSRPRPYVYSPPGLDFTRYEGRTLDLSGNDNAPYLGPGQEVRDAFANFKLQYPTEVLQQLQGILQHNGLNPIAQGQSPGSDPSGYTVNSLAQASLVHYEVILDNYCRLIEWLVDLARKVVRDVVKEKVLGLSPDDVDDTACQVTVDPLSDANRMALTQSVAQLNKQGYVSRRRVQEAAGVEDTDAEDDLIVQDAASEELANLAIEIAKGLVAGTITKDANGQYVSAAPQSPQEPGQTEAPTGPTSTAPPPPQGSSVGPEMAGAQQRNIFATKPGPALQQPSTARAGQAQTVRRMP